MSISSAHDASTATFASSRHVLLNAVSAAQQRADSGLLGRAHGSEQPSKTAPRHTLKETSTAGARAQPIGDGGESTCHGIHCSCEATALRRGTGRAATAPDEAAGDSARYPASPSRLPGHPGFPYGQHDLRGFTH
eukprot:5000826-Alexandrium_andersonii.AAC.1